MYSVYSDAWGEQLATFSTQSNIPYTIQHSLHNPTFPTQPNNPYTTQQSLHNPTIPTQSNIPYTIQHSLHIPSIPTQYNNTYAIQTFPSILCVLDACCTFESTLDNNFWDNEVNC